MPFSLSLLLTLAGSNCLCASTSTAAEATPASRSGISISSLPRLVGSPSVEGDGEAESYSSPCLDELRSRATISRAPRQHTPHSTPTTMPAMAPPDSPPPVELLEVPSAPVEEDEAEVAARGNGTEDEKVAELEGVPVEALEAAAVYVVTDDADAKDEDASAVGEAAVVEAADEEEAGLEVARSIEETEAAVDVGDAVLEDGDEGEREEEEEEEEEEEDEEEEEEDEGEEEEGTAAEDDDDGDSVAEDEEDCSEHHVTPTAMALSVSEKYVDVLMFRGGLVSPLYT